MSIRRIMHISDMHFSKNEDDKSLLQNKKYVDDWINSIKNIQNLDSLIISGDIVDKGGDEKTYEEVTELIKRIRKETEIRTILSVPGNHDVSRSLLIGISGDGNTDSNSLWKCYDQKLKYYWQFINANKINLHSNSGLVSFVELKDPDILLLGLDSTDKIEIQDSYGSINIENLKTEIEKILGGSDQKYNNYLKIAILHHTPIIYENSSQSIIDNNSCAIGQFGTCDAENWNQVKNILLNFGVHYVLTGHVHGSQSEQIRSFETEQDELIYSTVGSIGVDFSKELRKLLSKKKDKTLLDNLSQLRCYGSLNGNHNSYNIWTISSDGLVQEEQYKYIIDEGRRQWCLWKSKVFEKEHGCTNLFDIGICDKDEGQEETENYEEEILKKVRDYGLYKTGHYHWKNSTRLNWIDTSYFFQHREMLYYIARGINDIFEKEDKLQNVDCIIGLGIKGTILLSYIRFLFPQKKCSYLPESNLEHNKYERELFEENEQITTIAVLTDVVHSGKTLKEFAGEIYKKNQKFLHIRVVTIFDATPDGRIAKIREKADFLLYHLAKLKVIDCRGGGDNCDLYMKKLVNVVEYKEERDENY